MKQLLIALVLIFGSLTLINASAKTSDYVDPVNFKNVVAAWDISVTELTDQVPENHAFELGCGKGGTSCGLFTCCEANAPVCCGDGCCNPGNICCAGACSNQQCAVGCCQPPYTCCGTGQCCS